jgi:hypothetical protein
LKGLPTIDVIIVSHLMQQEEEKFQVTGVNQIAHRNKRIHNLIIDTSIIYLTFYSIVSSFFSINVYTQPFTLREYLFLYAVTFFYYFLFELFFHKTPGKYFTKTKVIMKNGAPADSLHILTRSLIRLLYIEILSFAGLYPVGWHDKYSGTIVIDQDPQGKLPDFIEAIIKIMKILLYIIIVLGILLLIVGIGILIYRYLFLL